MSDVRAMRRWALAGSTAALVMMGALTAGCSSTDEVPPTTKTPSTTTPPSTAPAVSATEKAISPGGDNSFSPTINPTPPPASCKSVVGGVCIR
ncbi:MAG: hypothetical protein KDB50_14485 [Mycobacterium sp.]|nr:hypothetical protein [Mycobacterium sp.]